MKKLLVMLIAALVTGQAIAYERIIVKNSTPFTAFLDIEYASLFCSDDHNVPVPPGLEMELPLKRGICLITKITGKVEETAEKLKDLGYGILSSDRQFVPFANAYESSGTGYHKFTIIGPILNQTNNKREYFISRFVE